jgi:hypothetical protein
VVPAEHMKIVVVSATHCEYIDGACIIWPGLMLYLAEVFVRWLRFLCFACVGLSDGHSDQQFSMVICSVWKYVDVSILVNKTAQK